jgi:hypothetical protein
MTVPIAAAARRLRRWIMARVMVEQAFKEPLTDERFAELAKQLDPCLEIRDGMWRRSALSKDKLRLVCEFEAPDAESVREALRLAKVPYERVWAADVFAVEDYPEMAAKLAALLEKNASRA